MSSRLRSSSLCLSIHPFSVLIHTLGRRGLLEPSWDLVSRFFPPINAPLLLENNRLSTASYISTLIGSGCLSFVGVCAPVSTWAWSLEEERQAFLFRYFQWHISSFPSSVIWCVRKCPWKPAFEAFLGSFQPPIQQNVCVCVYLCTCYIVVFQFKVGSFFKSGSSLFRSFLFLQKRTNKQTNKLVTRSFLKNFPVEESPHKDRHENVCFACVYTSMMPTPTPDRLTASIGTHSCTHTNTQCIVLHLIQHLRHPPVQ